MSYAIIRNAKYKAKNSGLIYRHIERKNSNYQNKEINQELSKFNYSFKTPSNTYFKLFSKIKNENNLAGRIAESSNIICEYIIKSDKEFFDKIGPLETKRFFKAAYDFACNFKNLGEDYILSAIVHMDETVPHMHVIYIPVVHTIDKDNKPVDKVSCSLFWDGLDSYAFLQNSFFDYMVSHGFNLEKGNHIHKYALNIHHFKAITNFEKIKEVVDKNKIEYLDTNSLELAIEKNKELVNYCHKLEKFCISSFSIFNQLSDFESELINVKSENQNQKEKINSQNIFINKLISAVSAKFNISKLDIINMLKEDRLK